MQSFFGKRSLNDRIVEQTTLRDDRPSMLSLLCRRNVRLPREEINARDKDDLNIAGLRCPTSDECNVTSVPSRQLRTRYPNPIVNLWLKAAGTTEKRPHCLTGIL